MEEQSDHYMYQVTPAKILGLACWDLWSRVVVLSQVGTTEITEFWDNLQQTSYANTMDSQET